MVLYKYEFQHWINDQRTRARGKVHAKPFIGSRGYFHFDKIVDISNTEEIKNLAYKFTSEKTIGKWMFFPFIRKDQRDRVYRIVAKKGTIKDRNQDLYTHVKSRPIMYASHQDACLFSYGNYILEKKYEKQVLAKKLCNNIIAYRRPGKSNVVYAKSAFDYLDKTNEYGCLLLDIKGFFNTILHTILKDKVEDIMGTDLDKGLAHILNNVTRYRYVFENEVIEELKKNKKTYFYERKRRGKQLCRIEDFNKLINNKKFIRVNNKKSGIPQGSPISGLLANIYLLDFDEFINTILKKYKTRFYQRYSDDIIIVCPAGKEKEIYRKIESKLKELGLILSTKKTEIFRRQGDNIVNITDDIEKLGNSKRENLQYLGLEWNGKQIVLRPSTISRRLRPKFGTRKYYWEYHKRASKIIGQTGIIRQYFRIRRSVMKKEANMDNSTTASKH